MSGSPLPCHRFAAALELLDDAGAGAGAALPGPGLVHPQPPVGQLADPAGAVPGLGGAGHGQMGVAEVEDVTGANADEETQPDLPAPVPRPDRAVGLLVVGEDRALAHVALVDQRHVAERPSVEAG